MNKEEHNLVTKLENNLLDGVGIDEIYGFRPQKRVVDAN
jgi:hypothetical protein